MSMYIRLATLKQSPIVFKFIKKLNEHHEGMQKFFYLTEESLLEDMKANLFNAALLYVKNAHDEKSQPAGLILFTYCFTGERGRGVYLDQYYVDEQLRGRGLGAFLMRWLCQWALYQSCRYVRVVYQASVQLEEFYQHMGYDNDTSKSGVSIYEVCHQQDVDRVLSKVSGPETLRMSLSGSAPKVVESRINGLCTLFTVSVGSSEANKCTLLVHESYSSWMGRTLLLSEFNGNEDLLNVAVMQEILMKIKKSKERPLWCIWVEYGGKSEKFLQTLKTFELVNISAEEGWNINVLTQPAVEKHAAKLGEFELIEEDEEGEDTDVSEEEE